MKLLGYRSVQPAACTSLTSSTWRLAGLFPALLALSACGQGEARSVDAPVDLRVSTQAIVESCNGGSDDDLDGLVDCVDPDCSANAACAAPMECRKSFWQVQTATSIIRQIVTTPATNAFTSSTVATMGIGSNAAGYNPRDGYFYAIGTGGTTQRHLLRIDSTGAYTDLGAVAILTTDAISPIAGDCDDRGNLYVKDTAGTSIYKISLTAPYTTTKYTLTTGLAGADIVYDRDLQRFYGVNDDTLSSWTVGASAATSIAITGATVDQATHAAAWTDGDGYVYALEGEATGDLRRIDPATGVATKQGTWTGTTPTDGAGCSYLLPPFEICANSTDDDGDGTADEATCITLRDSDGDGVFNVVDLDDDNDGIPDALEIGDTDGDGITNRLDLDSDNDGINDIIEAGHSGPDTNNNGMLDGLPAAFGSNGLLNSLETSADASELNYTIRDTDSDGTRDWAELDSDADGFSDLVEAGYVTATVDANNDSMADGVDTDRDGIKATVDGATAVYGDATAMTLTDSDNDGTPNYREVDSDNDGVCDGASAAAGCIAGPDSNRTNGTVCADSDGDGCNDCSSGTYAPGNDGADADGDGSCDTGDACDADATKSAAGVCGCGIADTDTDGDTIADCNDNCDNVANVTQTNSDGDPYGNACDCDNTRATVYPGASETCNGRDDDCDGSTDEGVTTTYYRDSDSDSYGNVAVTTQACSAPAGYVANNTDCDDTRATTRPGAAESCNGRDDDCDSAIDEGVMSTFYADSDSDGYGNASVTTQACSAPAGHVANNTDCDSTRSSVYPGATETCNSRDDDCDGSIDEGVQTTYYADADSDGFGNASVTTQACSAPAGYVANNADCDSTRASVYPGATETCNGRDDDCDGSTDEGVRTTYYADSDNDGFGNASVTTQACSAPAGYVANNTDCDSTRASVYPGATETCNGRDDDCDGSTDEGVQTTYYADADNDGFGSAAVTTQACSAPAGYVANSTDCNAANGNVYPGATESCNGLDDDCDSSIDEGVKSTFYADADSDGYGALSVTVQACSAPAGHVANSTDCDDSSSTVHPTASESCNGVDDDCDSTIDDNITFTTYYRDADGDGHGASGSSVSACSQPTGHVTSNSDCDDTRASVYPSASESCNGLDDDCDGSLDEGVKTTFYADADGDGLGDANSTTQACSAPAGFVASSGPDNCPAVANADQVNFDQDGEGDACDADDDNDGVCDGAEATASVCAAGPDTAPHQADRCGDSDHDSCDDCTRGKANATNDGDDADEDGVCDQGEDADRDGIKDQDDLDDDNDGVPDVLENAGRVDPDADADGDRVPNYLDADDRGDQSAAECDDADKNGRCDRIARWFDGDEDGVPNHLDLDADDDGIADLFEAGLIRLDADGDAVIDGAVGANGLADEAETSADSAEFAYPLLDTDGDGERDMFDRDSDDDGEPDLREVDALRPFDANEDGVLDRASDGDRDGIRVDGDVDDAYGNPMADPRDTDRDGDGVPRAYDAEDDGPEARDSDGDGVADDVECAGGWPCPDSDRDGTPNYMDGDSDGDGIHADLDLDDDNDGILDSVEESYEDADDDGIPNRLDRDSDGDGIYDVDEASLSSLDANHDGVVDGPVGPNGLPDAVELDGADSGTVAAPIDSDGDGEPDFVDTDSDDDGASDGEEAGDDDLRTPARDSDGDGTQDYRDDDDDDDGAPTRSERRAGDDLDTDLDGTPDRLDTDDDGDGIATKDEPSDEDENGTPDRLEPPEQAYLTGGALCALRAGTSDGAGSSLVFGLALAALLMARRRRRAA